jgi:hypothetical protein
MAKSLSNSCKKLTTSANTTNATLVSSVPCDVYHVSAVNTTAALKYLKLYNKASAPTVGTDVPVLTIPLAVSNVPTHFSIPSGLYFNVGLGFALTGADGDSDTTALAAGDVKGLNIVFA